MVTTVPGAFVEFATALRPSEADETMMRQRRERVEGFLAKEYPATSSMPLTSVKLIGSAQRKTLNRPIDDIDVFAIFDDSQVWAKYRSDSTQLLYRVREALTGLRIKTVGSRGQAVRLFYTDGPHVDITPAFPLYDGFGRHTSYYIPAGNGSWQQTDPFVHAKFTADRNKDLDGYLKPLVRLLKRWNETHSSRLSSFHLELLTQAVFGSMSSSQRESVHFFFLHAANYLHVSDPAGHSGDLAAGLSYNQTVAIEQSFSTALGHAERALEREQAGYPVEAIRQWQIIFGSSFPNYG